jgi:hypothetical protein
MSGMLKMVCIAIVGLALGASCAFAQGSHTSSQFQGPKANKGTVTHSIKDGKSVLTLSDDFVVPDTPDAHWQVVDSDGNVYLLDKLKTKAFIGASYKGNRRPEVRQEYCQGANLVRLRGSESGRKVTFGSPVM